jgi:hypothetical protein
VSKTPGALLARQNFTWRIQTYDGTGNNGSTYVYINQRNLLLTKSDYSSSIRRVTMTCLTVNDVFTVKNCNSFARQWPVVHNLPLPLCHQQKYFSNGPTNVSLVPSKSRLNSQLNPSLGLLNKLMKGYKLAHKEHVQQHVPVTVKVLTNFYKIGFTKAAQ